MGRLGPRPRRAVRAVRAARLPGSYLHHRWRCGSRPLPAVSAQRLQLPALGRSCQTLPSQTPNLAWRTEMSRGRKSLSRSASSVRSVPGRAGAQGAPVIAILPGNENERAGSGFHSLRAAWGRAGAGPAGAEPRGAVARGGVGPARILLPVDSPLGSLALASREMKVGFCGIWGPREPLALGSRPRQTNIGLMCLHRWIGGGPFMLSIWTRCLPLRRVTFVRMPFGWVEAPRPRPRVTSRAGVVRLLT